MLCVGETRRAGPTPTPRPYLDSTGYAKGANEVLCRPPKGKGRGSFVRQAGVDAQPQNVGLGARRSKIRRSVWKESESSHRCFGICPSTGVDGSIPVRRLVTPHAGRQDNLCVM